MEKRKKKGPCKQGPLGESYLDLPIQSIVNLAENIADLRAQD
jgi:hypothetical protein